MTIINPGYRLNNHKKKPFQILCLYIQVAYYLDESSVKGDVNQVQVIERKSTRDSEWDSGIGSDSGGGDTVGLLR